MRLFDFIVSLLGLIVLSPVFAVTWLLIKASSGGPVIFRAKRIGRGGRSIHVLKFRSMCVNAEHSGPRLTTADDPRVTWVGRILRRYKIDEFPQLLNVLKGEMSFVGPRPEDPKYVKHYSAEERQLLSLRPGITSPASLRFVNEESLLTGADWEAAYLERILPAKLALELEYVKKRSFWTDVVILFQTVSRVPFTHSQ